MEILLLCAWLVYTAGAQSEKAKVGLSPAQRDILRERTRHEKAVQKIADKHGAAAPADRKAGVSPWKEPPAAERPVLTLPEAFRSGYRGHTRIERVATPVGRRAGGWAAGGVGWVKDTGKGALREYRKRRRAEGHDDPAPVLVPLPPTRPPVVPPLPAAPPTAGTDSGKGKGVSMKKPEDAAGEKRPEGPDKAPEGATAPPAGGEGSPTAPEAPTGPETPPDGAAGGDPGATAPGTPEATTGPETPQYGSADPDDWMSAYAWKDDWSEQEPEAPDPEAPPAPEEAAAGPETEDAAAEPAPGAAETEPAPAPAQAEAAAAAPEDAAAGPETPAAEPESPPTAPEGTESGPIRGSEPAAAGGGVGRMAAEVTYESVEEESDELSLMCKEDSASCDRIKARADREVGRGDTLIAEMEATGFGQSLQAWVTRCKEDYQGMGTHLEDLKRNTMAQDEAVVRAKGHLIAGQGVYYGIALDMEQVAEREAYISDAVDSEDTSAHTEIYETRGA